jgi:hypothetical protein
MATAYTARAAEANYPVKSRPESGLVVQQINFSNPAVTVAINDSVELCKIPVNCLITDLYLTVSGFDTNAAPTGTVSLGLTKATAGEADIDTVGFMSAVTAKGGPVAKPISPLDFNGALVFPYLASGDNVATAPMDGVHSKLTFRIGAAALATAGTALLIRGWVGYIMDADWESASDPA